MNTVRALSVVALLALASGNALASSPTEIVRFDTKLPQSNRPAGGARGIVFASPELVRSVVLDFGNYARYFDPDKGKSKSGWASKVVGKSGDKTDLYLEVPILGGASKIWAIVRFDAPKKVGEDTEIVTGQMIKGNVEKLSAKWKMRRRAEDNSTELQLEFLVVPKLPVPDSFLAKEASSAAAKAVKGMKREALERGRR